MTGRAFCCFSYVLLVRGKPCCTAAKTPMNNEYRVPIQSICILVQRRLACPCIKQQDTQRYANGPLTPGAWLSLLSHANVPAVRTKMSDEEDFMRTFVRGQGWLGKLFVCLGTRIMQHTHKSSQGKPGHPLMLSDANDLPSTIELRQEHRVSLSQEITYCISASSLPVSAVGLRNVMNPARYFSLCCLLFVLRF